MSPGRGGRARVAGAGGVAAAFAIAVLVLAGCGPGSPAVSRSPDPSPSARSATRVLFVGASVTAGLFATTTSQSYADLVVQSLDAHRWVDVARLAGSGTTTRGALLWNVAIPSDIVIVQLGTNDYARNVSLDDFGQQYRQLLDRIRGASPRATLLCVSTWADPSNPNGAGLTGRQYDIVMERHCAADHGRMVDISGVYRDPANHGPVGRTTFLGVSDWFHPNDRGHGAIAFAVLGALDRWGGNTAQLTSPTSRSSAVPRER